MTTTKINKSGLKEIKDIRKDIRKIVYSTSNFNSVDDINRKMREINFVLDDLRNEKQNLIHKKKYMMKDLKVELPQKNKNDKN